MTFFSFLPDISSRTSGGQQEGITVIKEIHALGSQLVDSSYLTAQRSIYSLLEALRLFSHHTFRLLQGQAYRIVTTCKSIVQRSLITTQIYTDIFFYQTLPQVNDITHVCHRYRAFLSDSLADSGNQFVEVVMQLIHPSLLITFVSSQRIDLCHHADCTGNITSLRLSTRHTT